MLIFLSGVITGGALAVASYYAVHKYREIKSSVPFVIQVSYVERPLPAYVVEAKGDLLNTETEISYILKLQDLTGGVVSPIRFKTDKEDKTVETLTVDGPPVSVLPKAQLADWTKIVTLPMERIRFARQGVRDLCFTLKVVGAPVSGTQWLSTAQQSLGFVEVKEKLPDIYASIWYLVAGLRARFPDDSGLIVDRAAEFLVKEGQAWSSTERSIIFDSFREIVESSSATISWDDACATYAVKLQETADTDVRNDIMRLFYTLLIEDGGVQVEAGTALMIFYNVCTSIGLDMGVFTRLVDRFIMSHDLNDVPSGCLLGLYVGMDINAVKSRLTEEYKKWNARVTHSDPAIRERAAHMLQMISATRSEFR